MKNEFFYPSRDGVTQIHAIEWLPEGEPVGVLQMCHGMCEHIDRYDEFARYLAGNGFYVVGHDHLGHGQSTTSMEKLGYFTDYFKYILRSIIHHFICAVLIKLIQKEHRFTMLSHLYLSFKSI